MDIRPTPTLLRRRDRSVVLPCPHVLSPRVLSRPRRVSVTSRPSNAPSDRRSRNELWRYVLPWFALLIGSSQAIGATPNHAAGAQPNPPIRYWQTHWSFSELDVQQLQSRLASIGISVPVRMNGKVSVEFDVSIPWNQLRNGKAYRIVGSITSARLQIERLLLEEVQADLSYADGVLELRNLKSRWLDETADAQPGGSLSGSASAELLPRGQLRAELTAESLPLGPVQSLVRPPQSQRPFQSA
ncbi:MAG: hypothetical protein MI861_24500, partial [Pirellulales bacterium]|nr:hypothetical protein [Pirellulales bacterium]